MNLISIFLMLATSVLCLMLRQKEDLVLLSMVFKYILELQGYLIYMLFSLGDLERQMISVIRCLKLIEIP
jgi:hypothetical protein